MKCSTKGCKNEAAKFRTVCETCKHKAYREKNPKRVFFLNFRKAAKRRGKEFDLTYDQFLDFCNKTGYFEKRGTSGDALQIDRIYPDKGYTIDNIRVLTAYTNNKRQKLDLDGLELDPLDPPF